jgi:hypothetical protein
MIQMGTQTMFSGLTEEIELFRDQTWRRNPDMIVEDRAAAEAFIETVGFCSALTDSRRPGPSLYIAVCGRRDAHMPRNVQKDPETSLAWFLKDEIMRAGRVYYAKLVKARSTFIARRLVPYFYALWGLSRRKESQVLSDDARLVLKVLRKEWEMATPDLKRATGIKERQRLIRAIDELQRTMKVIPGDVMYEPVFTYIWTLAEGRFPAELAGGVSRADALREIARAYLNAAGVSGLGELSRVTGLSRPDAGRGNHQLVDEGYALRVSTGIYRLASLNEEAC